MRWSTSFITLSALMWFSPAQASTWNFDSDHSNVGFSVKHAMISNVHGSFRKASGTLELDDKDISKSKVDIEIVIDSIDTRNDKRDAHLKSPDFFNAAKFPTMTFKSTKVKKSGKGLEVDGLLTMHGVSKNVVLKVEGPTPAIKDPFGMMRSAASATAKINRKDFGLTWSQALEAGGVLVGDEISIQIDAEFVKKVEPAK